MLAGQDIDGTSTRPPITDFSIFVGEDHAIASRSRREYDARLWCQWYDDEGLVIGILIHYVSACCSCVDVVSRNFPNQMDSLKQTICVFLDHVYDPFRRAIRSIHELRHNHIMKDLRGLEAEVVVLEKILALKRDESWTKMDDARNFNICLWFLTMLRSAKALPSRYSFLRYLQNDAQVRTFLKDAETFIPRQMLWTESGELLLVKSAEWSQCKAIQLWEAEHAVVTDNSSPIVTPAQIVGETDLMQSVRESWNNNYAADNATQINGHITFNNYNDAMPLLILIMLLQDTQRRPT